MGFSLCMLSHHQKLKSKCKSDIPFLAIKGSRRTYLCSCHASGVNLPSPDVLFAAVFDMVFRPPYSPHLRLPHAQVTVSLSQGDHRLLSCASESNGFAPLRAHLRRDPRAPAR